MIFDSLNHLPRYNIHHANKILEFISQNDCLNLPNGQINIAGQELFVKVMEYEPQPAFEKQFETHTIHADLQYIVSGIELMQVTPQKSLTPTIEYDAQGDYKFYKAEKLITDIVVEAGHFVVFYPGEAHRPACLYQNNKNKVKKLVFKIRMK